MARTLSFHGAPGALDFLGLRQSIRGETEIVYDDGVARRMIWRVDPGASADDIGAALRAAASQRRVLPALHAELRKRAIAIEAVVR
ncbi:MAG: hypothetical protein ACK4TB_16225 [Gemmobacter sp.]